MKYIRKHSYAPEEQKHARLYEVRGVTKGGHELPVEVNVTSFVLDGEMFYTGVISEMAKAKDSKRSSVSSSMSDLNEVALHQRVSSHIGLVGKLVVDYKQKKTKKTKKKKEYLNAH